jgi:hypothetical protein
MPTRKRVVVTNQEKICGNCRHWRDASIEQVTPDREGTCLSEDIAFSIYPDVNAIARELGVNSQAIVKDAFNEIYYNYYHFHTDETFTCGFWEAKDG